MRTVPWVMSENIKYLQDPFMNRSMVKQRLLDEYNKYGSLIIAYDFDYTVHPFKNEDWTFEYVSKLLRSWRPYAKFIVFTASPESRFAYIKGYLDSHNLPYDAINEEVIERKYVTRKIYYNVLLDDRAGLGEIVSILEEILEEISCKKPIEV